MKHNNFRTPFRFKLKIFSTTWKQIILKNLWYSLFIMKSLIVYLKCQRFIDKLLHTVAYILVAVRSGLTETVPDFQQCPGASAGLLIFAGKYQFYLFSTPNSILQWELKTKWYTVVAFRGFPWENEVNLMLPAEKANKLMWMPPLVYCGGLTYCLCKWTNKMPQLLM